MKITKNLLTAIEKAEKDGYTHVNCIVNQCYNTKYYQTHGFDVIRKMEIGSSTYAANHSGRWSGPSAYTEGTCNGKGIDYQRLFQLYGKH